MVDDIRITRRSLQLLQMPYCSLLEAADDCEDRENHEAVIACAEKAFAVQLPKLLKEKASLQGSGWMDIVVNVTKKGDRAFATWRAPRYADEVARVLAGDNVLLRADIGQGFVDAFAVKLRDATLQFWHPDEASRAALNAELRNFKLMLTHMGDSHFKCDGGQVVVGHRAVNMSHSLTRRSNGNPDWYVADYEKVSSGDAVLSPYALWSVQLVPWTDSAAANFTALAAFAGNASISLVGVARYISTPPPCDSCPWSDHATPR